jgi:hypothetical protein
MQSDFRLRTKNKDYVTLLKTIYQEFAAGPNKKLITQLFSAGVFKLEDPIVDFRGGQSLTAKANKANIVLINQSVKNKEGITIFTRVQYSPAVLNEKDAVKFMNSVNYMLTNIPQQTRLRDAVDELKREPLSRLN